MAVASARASNYFLKFFSEAKLRFYFKKNKRLISLLICKKSQIFLFHF